jgi:hypothetical protein
MTPARRAAPFRAPQTCIADMSVLDLAIFMRVHRANRVSFARDVSGTIGNWFACTVAPIEIEQGFRRMFERGWLMRRTKGVRATIAGRAWPHAPAGTGAHDGPGDPHARRRPHDECAEPRHDRP